MHKSTTPESRPPKKAWSVSVSIPDFKATSTATSNDFETPTGEAVPPSNEMLFRKYTRRFVDSELEEEYTLYITNLNVKFQKAVLVLATIMIVIMLSITFSPPYLPHNTLHRTLAAMATVVNVITFFLLFVKRLYKYNQYIITFTFTFYAIVLLVDQVWDDNDSQASFVSGVIIVMTLICRIKFMFSIVVVPFLIVVHYILAAAYGHDKHSALAIIGFPIGLMAAAVICLYPSYYLDSMSRRAFLNNTIMALEGRKLSQLRMRVDALLNNIFPPILRQKLQEHNRIEKEQQQEQDNKGGHLLCDEHHDVTVLMADIVGFTSLSSRISPQQLVEMLNTVFSMFDDIIDELDMEKIRTLGDAYLCVANMTYKVLHPQDLVVTAARRMIAVLPALNEMFKVDPPLALRIGIASGPVISGVTGLSKWNYDIFGKTVVETFQMEALSQPLCITVTEKVWKALKGDKNSFKPVVHGKYTVYVSGDFNDKPRALPTIQMTKTTNTGLVLVDVDEDHGEINDVTSKVIAKSEFYQQMERTSSTKAYRTDSNEQLNIKDLTGNSESRELIKRASEEFRKYTKKRNLNLTYQDSELCLRYLVSIAKSSQLYTTRLTVLLIITFILWIICDIMSANTRPKDMPIEIWITYTVVIFVAGVFALFSRSRLFFSAIAEPINAIYIMIIGCILASQQWFDSNSVAHAVHPWLVIFVCFQYLRMRHFMALTAGFVVFAVSVGIFIAKPFHEGPLYKGANLNHLALYVEILAVAGFANYHLEIAVRKEYLSDLILRLNMQEQDDSNRQAKLLLYNILPRQIANRLGEQHSNTVIVDTFPNATMTFATLLIGDLALHPKEMFVVLNDVFTLFDKLAKELQCEKIKTINTTYMVVSGLPKERSDHAPIAVKMALCMFEALDGYKCPFQDRRTGRPFQIGLRIGVASGPVVAGVIGKVKYAYDCWSDVTNTASRMESNGLEGYIQTTQEVYDMAKDRFPKLQKRDGVQQIKGKGEMETYLLKY